MRKWFESILKYIRENRFNRGLMRHFDWPLFLIVLAISLFGVVSIFSATTITVTEKPATVMEMLSTQPITYARLQLLWILAGIGVMSAIMYFSYDLYGKYANVIYFANILILLAVLTVEAGRGGMTAFFSWGSSSERTFQPSEVGKIAIIIAFARAFAVRKKEIVTVRDILPLVIYLAIPLILIVAQPDIGTAMVYIAVFCIMVFVSGTSYKLILGALVVAILVAIPAWYLLNASGGNFRLTRILMWLHPDEYPDEARQVINAQIAAGSGGLWGKGIVSVGSFASLGYISDDHTDFIFAIVCESFGFAGGFALVVGYILMLARMAWLAHRVRDPLGSYMIVGVLSMFMFHIIENVCMVIGLLPVTGIPLPFMSYGGSNMLTNMMGIGLVMNVVMRDRIRNERVRTTPGRSRPI
jgi:rod shape determining protein RodA